MQRQADIAVQDNTFIVKGDINFTNVMSVFQSSLPSLRKNKELHFDFSQLQSSDSSGLALMIEWIKFAKTHNKIIRFSHVSDDLMLIAKAAYLDQLIV